MTENNWAALLAGRLTLGCTSPMHPRDSLPFAPPRGREAATYATLPVENRWVDEVLLLLLMGAWCVTVWHGIACSGITCSL